MGREALGSRTVRGRREIWANERPPGGEGQTCAPARGDVTCRTEVTRLRHLWGFDNWDVGRQSWQGTLWPPVRASQDPPGQRGGQESGWPVARQTGGSSHQGHAGASVACV